MSVIGCFGGKIEIKKLEMRGTKNMTVQKEKGGTKNVKQRKKSKWEKIKLLLDNLE